MIQHSTCLVWGSEGGDFDDDHLMIFPSVWHILSCVSLLHWAFKSFITEHPQLTSAHHRLIRPGCEHCIGTKWSFDSQHCLLLLQPQKVTASFRNSGMLLNCLPLGSWALNLITESNAWFWLMSNISSTEIIIHSREQNPYSMICYVTGIYIYDCSTWSVVVIWEL